MRIGKAERTWRSCCRSRPWRQWVWRPHGHSSASGAGQGGTDRERFASSSASTFITAGDTGWITIRTAYTQGGATAYDTVACLIITDDAPDTPLTAVVMEDWGNDTSVVNTYNVDYTVVEVTLPDTTNDCDTIEIKLSDGTTDAVAEVAGGETVVYGILDCTDLDDGDLTLTARAYNAAGSATLTGTPASKDATAPTITLTQPVDDTVTLLPHVTGAGVCADTDVETFTVNAEPVERDGAGGSFETTLFLVDGAWGTWIDRGGLRRVFGLRS